LRLIILNFGTGLTFLKPRIAPWRYQRGSRSLAENLKSDVVSAGGGIAKVVLPPPPQPEEERGKEEDEEDFDIPEELEEVVEELIQGLRHTDIIVRYVIK
jgi:hypothetical protein